jgi:hypothetical protein
MEPLKTEIDRGNAPQKIGATSIAEIERLIEQLQETRNFLESEGERIQRETARYINLTQRALASVRIIFDTLSGAADHHSPNPLSPAERARGRAERISATRLQWQRVIDGPD